MDKDGVRMYMCGYSLRCVQFFVTLRTVACQAPLSVYSRQEYWSGLPFPSPMYVYITYIYIYIYISVIVVVQSLSHVQLFETP